MPRQVERILKLIENVEPPEECQAAHALLVSAAHLARNAAAIRVKPRSPATSPAPRMRRRRRPER